MRQLLISFFHMGGFKLNRNQQTGLFKNASLLLTIQIFKAFPAFTRIALVVLTVIALFGSLDFSLAAVVEETAGYIDAFKYYSPKAPKKEEEKKRRKRRRRKRKVGTGSLPLFPSPTPQSGRVWGLSGRFFTSWMSAHQLQTLDWGGFTPIAKPGLWVLARQPTLRKINIALMVFWESTTSILTFGVLATRPGIEMSPSLSIKAGVTLSLSSWYASARTFTSVVNTGLLK